MSARAPRSPIDGQARPRFPRSRRRIAVSVDSFRNAGNRFSRRRRRYSRRLAATAALALASAAALAAIGIGDIWLPHEIATVERAATSLGFGIARLDVHGNRYTRTSDIVVALGLAEGMSQLAFDAVAAKRRIEALPWVLKAGIHRSLPDGIGVEITERRPAIVWRDLDRDVLLDVDGRELSALPRGSDLGLPMVTGAAAGDAAPGYIALLEQYPRIQPRIVEARRVEGRRWTLQLTGGTLVHLPADGIAAALAWLEIQASAGLLDAGLETIDLRVPGQLVVYGRDAAPVENGGRARLSTRAASAAGGAP